MEKTDAKNEGLFSSLKCWKIKFNPRPFSDPKPLMNFVMTKEEATIATTNLAPEIDEFEQKLVQIHNHIDSFIDRHASVVSKVDSLISEWEKETTPEDEDWEIVADEENTLTPETIVMNLEK